jgi:hypothetical protein
VMPNNASSSRMPPTKGKHSRLHQVQASTAEAPRLECDVDQT